MENKKIIEELAESIVLLDIEDKHLLGNVHNLFESLAENISEEGLEEIINNTLTLIEKLIMDEAENPDQALEAVNQTISGLQNVFNDDKDYRKVDFPELVDSDQKETTGNNGSNLPNHVEEEIFAEFLSKQETVLQEMEAILLDVEQSEDEEDWRKLKAILHTMKGEAAMVGLEEVGDRCHKAEDIIESGKTSETIDQLFDLKDWLDKTFKGYTEGENQEAESNQSQDSADRVTQEESKKSGQSEATSKRIDENKESEDSEEEEKIEEPELVADFISEATEHIETIDRDLLQIESDPTDSNTLNSLFRAFHTIKGVAGFLNLKDIQELSHVSEDLLDSARKGQLYLNSSIIDVIFEAVDKLKEMIHELRNGLQEGVYPPRDPDIPDLIEQITRLNDENSGNGKQLSEEQKVDKSSKKGKAKAEQKTAENQSKSKNKTSSKKSTKKVKNPKVKVKETIKISADKLDRMVDMIGELVIAESMVTQADQVRDIESLNLEKKLNRLDKITRELQEIGLYLRMIPVKSKLNKKKQNSNFY